MLSGTSREDRGITRVCRELKSNVSECKIASGGHDKSKMAVAATTSSGRDGTGISVDFLGKKFKRGVGGGADNGHKAGMGKGQRGCWGVHGGVGRGQTEDEEERLESSKARRKI